MLEPRQIFSSLSQDCQLLIFSKKQQALIENLRRLSWHSVVNLCKVRHVLRIGNCILERIEDALHASKAAKCYTPG